jgi:hypothetical protein
MTWREYIAILKKQPKLTIFRIIILAVAGWWSLVEGMILSSYQSVYLTYPRTPDLETHRIVPYAFKHTVRYITKEQMETIHRLDWTLIILGVFITVNLLIHLKWPLPSK